MEHSKTGLVAVDALGQKSGGRQTSDGLAEMGPFGQQRATGLKAQLALAP